MTQHGSSDPSGDRVLTSNGLFLRGLWACTFKDPQVLIFGKQ